MQDRHFTKHFDFKTHFLTFGLKFEDQFRFLMLLLKKYLDIKRIKIFDLNIVKKKKRQSKVSQKSVKVTLQHCTCSLFMVTFAVI